MKMRPSKYVVIGGYNWSKETEMSYNLKAVRPGTLGVGRFMLLTNNDFLVGFFKRDSEMLRLYCEQMCMAPGTRPELRACGLMLVNGEIPTWESQEYYFVTPEDMRLQIMAFMKNQTAILEELFLEVYSRR